MGKCESTWNERGLGRTRPNGAANTGSRYVLITCSTYHSNYRERRHIQIFASVHLLLRVDHPRYLSALRKVICQHYKISKNLNWVFPHHDALDEKRNYSRRFQFVNQTSTMRASGGWLRARRSETGQHSQDLHMPKFLYNQSTTLDDSFFSTACPAGPHASIQDLLCHTINSSSGCMCPMNWCPVCKTIRQTARNKGLKGFLHVALSLT